MAQTPVRTPTPTQFRQTIGDLLTKPGVSVSFRRHVKQTLRMERRLDEWRWLLHQVRQGVEAQQLAHWKKYPKKYRVELKAAGVAEEGAESPLPAIGHQGDLPLA